MNTPDMYWWERITGQLPAGFPVYEPLTSSDNARLVFQAGPLDFRGLLLQSPSWYHPADDDHGYYRVHLPRVVGPSPNMEQFQAGFMSTGPLDLPMRTVYLLAPHGLYTLGRCRLSMIGMVVTSQGMQIAENCELVYRPVDFSPLTN